MSLQSIPLPPLPSAVGRLAAIHPLPGKTAGSTSGLASINTDFSLLAVNDRAELLCLAPIQSEFEVLAVLDIPDFESSKPIQIVTSPQGEYTPVSNRFGRYADVFALPDLQGQSARLLFRLDRGDYHFDTCLFSLSFTELDGQLILVHGSDWNRLDEEDWAEVGDQPTLVIYDSRTGLIFRAIREVPAYLNSLTLIPKMDVFPHLLADMVFADEQLFIWGYSVPLHVWSLSDVGNDSLEQLTEFAFNEALYYPSAKLFIDLQTDGNLQAYRRL